MPAVDVKKKEGESSSALFFRFSKRVKRSGVLKEANKRRFLGRPTSKRQRKLSAIHRDQKKTELARARKLGIA